jgi:hypothetical protein
VFTASFSPAGAFVFALTELLGPFPFIFVVQSTKHVCGHERPDGTLRRDVHPTLKPASTHPLCVD